MNVPFHFPHRHRTALLWYHVLKHRTNKNYVYIKVDLLELINLSDEIWILHNKIGFNGIVWNSSFEFLSFVCGKIYYLKEVCLTICCGFSGFRFLCELYFCTVCWGGVSWGGLKMPVQGCFLGRVFEKSDHGGRRFFSRILQKKDVLKMNFYAT